MLMFCSTRFGAIGSVFFFFRFYIFKIFRVFSRFLGICSIFGPRLSVFFSGFTLT